MGLRGPGSSEWYEVWPMSGSLWRQFEVAPISWTPDGFEESTMTRSAYPPECRRQLVELAS
jgi:hypothetical protein